MTVDLHLLLLLLPLLPAAVHSPYGDFDVGHLGGLEVMMYVL